MPPAVCALYALIKAVELIANARASDHGATNRIYANITPVELARILEPLTTTARIERLKVYKDKWFIVESKVLDVVNNVVRVDVSTQVIEPLKVIPLAGTSVEMKDYMNATLLFKGSSWPQLSHADKGFYIKAEGQIADVPHYSHIIFINCNLKYLGVSAPTQPT